MEADKRMKKLLAMALLLAGFACANTPAPEIKHGPKGGCYVTAKRKKDGTEYKRYVKCPEVKK